MGWSTLSDALAKSSIPPDHVPGSVQRVLPEVDEFHQRVDGRRATNRPKLVGVDHRHEQFYDPVRDEPLQPLGEDGREGYGSDIFLEDEW